MIHDNDGNKRRFSPDLPDSVPLSVPIWRKLCLTVEEAAVYSHIGEHRLREIANDPANANLILRIGNKVVFKRPALESYIMGLQRI